MYYFVSLRFVFFEQLLGDLSTFNSNFDYQMGQASKPRLGNKMLMCVLSVRSQLIP